MYNCRDEVITPSIVIDRFFSAQEMVGDRPRSTLMRIALSVPGVINCHNIISRGLLPTVKFFIEMHLILKLVQ